MSSPIPLKAVRLSSIDAESLKEVNEMARKAEKPGENVFGKPAENGCAFTDPDGYRWNVLYMDLEKMSK